MPEVAGFPSPFKLLHPLEYLSFLGCGGNGSCFGLNIKLDALFQMKSEVGISEYIGGINLESLVIP